ncbi:MAG: non-lysosomal glucosylceramidase [Planctomycetota bacterium]|nr:non-lysosomal glucosylceramidase [Planctomycetota bacterium]
MPASVPYTSAELRRSGKVRSFTGPALDQIAFPLGGIGTGTVSLGGRGQLQDWEIYNRPGKGNMLPMTFFAVWAQAGKGAAPVAKILERRILPPYHAGHGYPRHALSGVARLDEATFCGEYPFARIEFADRELPVRASLEAFTPFIPLREDDSSYPVAIFHWSFRNSTKQPLELALLASMHNPIGRHTIGVESEIKQLQNQYRFDDALRGLWFSAPGLPANDPNFMTAALATPWNDVDVQTHLYKGGWWDSAHLLWDDFAEDGRLTPRVLSTFGEKIPQATQEHKPPGFFDLAQGKTKDGSGALCLRAKVRPGETVTLPVYLAWHTPHLKAWTDNAVVRTYMSAQFKDAWDAAARLHANKAELESGTRAWHRAFFGSTLPPHVLDAVSSQASIVRTPTSLRLADGQFYGWEGCSDQAGCCAGTCTHVWNYEQALAFLFPALERSIRRNEFLNSTYASGAMRFRTSMPANLRTGAFHPAADGQMGCIIRAYREWRLCGDESWLREIWPGLKRALEFAWTEPQGWDPDKDGVMEGCQHNTYDIEFYGPNTMMGAMYLGALEAGARLAEIVGEPSKAEEYRAIAAKGRVRMEKELFNGEFFIQKVDVMKGLDVPEHLRGPKDLGAAGCDASCDCNAPPGGKAPALEPGKDFEVKYQYGEGCLSDQLLGQWAAHCAGLGYVLDESKVRKAVGAVFKHNFRKPIGGFSNVQRVYALNDEAGLLLCSWPKGARPRLPFVYSDEVWTGIEYQVAAHLIFEGLLDEGLAVVKGIRDRHDGVRRNPWNEFECGHHYARAMASWSVLQALSGFKCDVPAGRLAFAPKLNAENFRVAFSAGTGWGTYSQKAGKKDFRAALELGGGRFELRRVDLAIPGAARAKGASAKLDGRELKAGLACDEGGCSVTFTEPLELSAGRKLEIAVR